MKYKKIRFTKAIAEAAEERRNEMFAGLSEMEIKQQIPINKGYLYEYENERASNWGLFISECVICGHHHKHGNGGSGTYSIHCDNGGGPFPWKYDVQLDMTDEDNIRLAEKYGLK